MTLPLPDWATALDDRIRTQVHEIRAGWADLQELLEQASKSELHTALGFASWTAYVADVFGEAPLQMDRPNRREAVAYMADQGMSTRAIGAVMGVAGTTVGRDLAIHDMVNEREEGRQIKGMDGGDYPRPPARRKDVEERRVPPEKKPTIFRQASAINQHLLDVVEAIEEIARDKRYSAHRDTVALAFKPSFDRIDRVRLFLAGDLGSI